MLRTVCTAALPRRGLHTSVASLSGHNRWSKIRHSKGAADAARSKQFTKMSKEILASLRNGASADPKLNPKLAAVLHRARAMGYPKANQEATIARATNPQLGQALQNVTYEAMGPGGQIGLMIECMTDNASRTSSRVKEQLTKYG